MPITGGMWPGLKTARSCQEQVITHKMHYFFQTSWGRENIFKKINKSGHKYFQLNSRKWAGYLFRLQLLLPLYHSPSQNLAHSCICVHALLNPTLLQSTSWGQRAPGWAEEGVMQEAHRNLPTVDLQHSMTQDRQILQVWILQAADVRGKGCRTQIASVSHVTV